MSTVSACPSLTASNAALNGFPPIRARPTLLHSGAVKLSAAFAAMATFAAASMTAPLAQLVPEITSGFFAVFNARAISSASGKLSAEGALESSAWATAWS